MAPALPNDEPQHRFGLRIEIRLHMMATIMETETTATIAPTPAHHSHRMLPVKLAVLFLCAFLVAFFVAPTRSRVVGYYISPSDSGLVVIQVKEDGTYIQYDQTQEISRGRWRLGVAFFVFKSLVLEDSYHLPVSTDDLKAGKAENWYPLFHRAGELCFRGGPDPEYWCKHKSMQDVEQ
jgi:hypothetical protein